MNTPKFIMVKRVRHVVGGVEPREERVRRFDEDSRSIGVDGFVGESDHMADGGEVCLIHRLVGFGLAEDADFGVVFEDGVPGVGDSSDRGFGVFGLADIGSFAGEPEDVVFAADRAGDVDASFGAVERVASIGGVVRGEGAVDCACVFPQSGSDDLDKEPFAVEDGLDRGDSLLGGAPIKIGGNDIVVVKLNGVETEFFVRSEFIGEGEFGSNGGAEWIGAGADIPGAEREAILRGMRLICHGRRIS